MKPTCNCFLKIVFVSFAKVSSHCRPPAPPLHLLLVTFLCPLLLLAFLPHNVSIPPFSATLTPLHVFVFSLYLYCSLGSQKQHSQPSTHIWVSLRTETRIQHQGTSQSSHVPQDTIQDRSFHMLVTRCACQRKFINMTGFWHFWHYRLEMWIFSDDSRKKADYPSARSMKTWQYFFCFCSYSARRTSLAQRKRANSFCPLGLKASCFLAHNASGAFRI